jgi:hypothetical protein
LLYATLLKFEEAPDYRYVTSLFTDCLRDSKLMDTDLRFEWEIEVILLIASFSRLLLCSVVLEIVADLKSRLKRR